MVLDQPNKLARELGRICYRAGEAIMRVYVRPELWETTEKQDHSPVTAADLAAHQVIVQSLNQLVPRLPVLSEEEAVISWATRRQWARYWLVDPLDGTREFLARNGEFTVNIALIEHGQPVFGMVHLPASGQTYYGGKRFGSFIQPRDGEARTLRTRSLNWPQLNLVGSHRHATESMQQVQDALQQAGAVVNAHSMGSSLKFCRIAEGLMDFYPRLGPTSEWDTAAAQAVVEGAGGRVLDWSFRALTYNQKPSLENPPFMVIGDLNHPWQEWLAPLISKNSRS
ncbi:3'(2'), 5'-bisphosphate nucleotidase [Marinospirillum alkaliphilum DSM 21637]|uniref:3'(2'),5'-bisphosphate nucleotidase CysQ n=1 Tax=Marinospirillum alkaliphilum DSM 21637 TaxID=1122209 RepID=A0A1K1ZCW0_9GAMM|nr:3'(2'), 5'-bisphosphate nucleotidase [Marinospirillum alkaliphilum DSM 21637]